MIKNNIQTRQNNGKKPFLYRILPAILAPFIWASSSSCAIAFELNCDLKATELDKKFTLKQDDENLYKEIELELKKVLPICSKNVALRVIMADVKLALGNNNSALKYINDALHIQPDNPSAIHVKGIVLSLLGSADESLELIENSLSLEPNNIDFLVNYCSTLEIFLRYEDAIKICSRAIEHDDAPSVVYFIRGRSYESLNRLNEAKKDYDKAKQLGFTM